MTSKDIIFFIHNNHKRIIVGISIVLVLAVLLFGASGFSKNVSANTINEKHFKCITIERGDTLWSVAEEYITEEYASIDEYIEEVRHINNLTDDVLYNGATLMVPYYSAP